jgi:hypothetical protein
MRNVHTNCIQTLKLDGLEQVGGDSQKTARREQADPMYQHIIGPSSYASLDFSVFLASQLTRLHIQEFFGSEFCSEAGFSKPSFSVARFTKFRQVRGHKLQTDTNVSFRHLYLSIFLPFDTYTFRKLYLSRPLLLDISTFRHLHLLIFLRFGICTFRNLYFSIHLPFKPLSSENCLTIPLLIDSSTFRHLHLSIFLRFDICTFLSPNS